MKNKTLSAWLAFVGGSLGLHRFYLYGLKDLLGWLYWIPTTLGLYGFWRVQQYGVDDKASWVLIPCWGFMYATVAATAIFYGLSTREKWNARFNPGCADTTHAGDTQWLTIGAVALALLVGTTALTASIVYSFQRYFENQIEQARQISQ